MNKSLWKAVSDFVLDTADESYGFSTRLAYENSWTVAFTNGAINEYKKFMYLAATSTTMVSPSAIVDIVWHQHLIYTNSYTAFCSILGKRIEHIPSNHSKKERERFFIAKQQTKLLYEENFGPQPELFWHFEDELQSLILSKSSISFNRIVFISICVFSISFFPFYFLSKPILLKIDNPIFLFLYIVGFLIALFCLDVFAKKHYTKLLKKNSNNLIISNLNSLELLYLKTNQIKSLVHFLVNKLIMSKDLVVLKNKKIQPRTNLKMKSVFENEIVKVLNDFELMYYPQLIKLTIQKPLFQQFSKSGDKLRNYFEQSKEVQKVIIISLIVIGLFFSVGFSRLFIGLYREIPVKYLVFVLIIQFFVSHYFLKRMLSYFFSETLIHFYQNTIIGKSEKTEWDYVFFGKAALAASFIPMVGYSNRKGDSYHGGCGSSCGGGSSCGSSCGGCGGCGGCGS